MLFLRFHMMVWQMLSDDNNDNNVHDDEYEARRLCDMATQPARFKLILSKLIINGGVIKGRGKTISHWWRVHKTCM